MQIHRREPRFFLHVDGQTPVGKTDRHGEADGRFSQFYERALKHCMWKISRHVFIAIVLLGERTSVHILYSWEQSVRRFLDTADWEGYRWHEFHFLHESDTAISLHDSWIAIPHSLTNVIRWVKPRPVRIPSRELCSRPHSSDVRNCNRLETSITQRLGRGESVPRNWNKQMFTKTFPLVFFLLLSRCSTAHY